MSIRRPINPNLFNNATQKKGLPFEGKDISIFEMKKMGIEKDSIRIVESLEELRQFPHAIIVAEAFRKVSFSQQRGLNQTLAKKGKYVMGLGIYKQLHISPNGQKLLKPASIKFKNIYNKYEGDDLTNKTLLVWRTGGIGDLLFIQPNLIHLKEKYPTCKIIFACGPQYQPMVETWDCVDEVLNLPFGVSRIKEADYHIIFEGVIERTKQAERENALRLFSHWMGLDLDDKLLIPQQEAKEDKLEDAREVIKEWGLEEGEFITMQIKASSPIRTPSFGVWKKIANTLLNDGHKIVLVDGKHNTKYIEDFIKTLDSKHKDNVFNFCPHSETLDSGIAAVKLSKCVVCTDSAMSHIAVSVGVPVMGIFGPFPGYIRLDTYPNVDWIDCKKDCAPCYMHGQDACKHSIDGNSLCYENINIEEFKDKINNLLGK